MILFGLSLASEHVDQHLQALLSHRLGGTTSTLFHFTPMNLEMAMLNFHTHIGLRAFPPCIIKTRFTSRQTLLGSDPNMAL